MEPGWQEGVAPLAGGGCAHHAFAKLHGPLIAAQEESTDSHPPDASIKAWGRAH